MLDYAHRQTLRICPLTSLVVGDPLRCGNASSSVLGLAESAARPTNKIRIGIVEDAQGPTTLGTDTVEDHSKNLHAWFLGPTSSPSRLVGC